MTRIDEIRLPLQTGGGALGNLLWMALCLGVASLAALFCLAVTRLDGKGSVWFIIAIPAIVSLAFFATALGLRKMYVQQRATDIVVTPDFLRLVGGRHHGFTRPWSEISPGDSRIVIDRSQFVRTSSGVTEYHANLFLRTEEGRSLLLAESVDPEEKLSLEEIRQSIAGAAESRSHRPLPPSDAEPPVHVLQCGNCGRPVTPADAPEVVCSSCGSAVRVSDELRGKITVAASLERGREHLEQLVGGLLDQPSAQAPNAVLRALEVLLLATPVLVLASFAIAPGFSGTLPALRVIALALPAGFALTAAMRLLLVDRQALRDLTLGMSARAPRHEGELPSCRQCGGELLPREGHILAICLFCQTENLLGLDLRPAEAETQARRYELGNVVDERTRRRRRALTQLLIALVVTVAVIPALLTF